MRLLIIHLLLIPQFLLAGSIVTAIDSLQNIQIENYENVKYTLSHNQWLICIDSAGNTMGFDCSNLSVGPIKKFDNSLHFSKSVRSIVSIFKVILVIYTDGTTDNYRIENLSWQKQNNLSGSGIANGEVTANFILGSPFLVSVINVKGEILLHPVSSSIADPTKLMGMAIATGGTPALDVLLLDMKVMVLNSQGEIWQHELTVISPKIPPIVNVPSRLSCPVLSEAVKLLAINSNMLAVVNKNGTFGLYSLK